MLDQKEHHGPFLGRHAPALPSMRSPHVRRDQWWNASAARAASDLLRASPSHGACGPLGNDASLPEEFWAAPKSMLLHGPPRARSVRARARQRSASPPGIVTFKRADSCFGTLPNWTACRAHPCASSNGTRAGASRMSSTGPHSRPGCCAIYLLR